MQLFSIGGHTQSYETTVSQLLFMLLMYDLQLKFCILFYETSFQFYETDFMELVSTQYDSPKRFTR
jgi:hypothetical protein